MTLDYSDHLHFSNKVVCPGNHGPIPPRGQNKADTLPHSAKRIAHSEIYPLRGNRTMIPTHSPRWRRQDCGSGWQKRARSILPIPTLSSQLPPIAGNGCLGRWKPRIHFRSENFRADPAYPEKEPLPFLTSRAAILPSPWDPLNLLPSPAIRERQNFSLQLIWR